MMMMMIKMRIHLNHLADTIHQIQKFNEELNAKTSLMDYENVEQKMREYNESDKHLIVRQKKWVFKYNFCAYWILWSFSCGKDLPRERFKNGWIVSVLVFISKLIFEIYSLTLDIHARSYRVNIFMQILLGGKCNFCLFRHRPFLSRSYQFVAKHEIPKMII